MTLTNIDKFASEDEGKMNRIKAQALAIRGLVHFDILRYWVNDYTNANAAGIPIWTSSIMNKSQDVVP